MGKSNNEHTQSVNTNQAADIDTSEYSFANVKAFLSGEVKNRRTEAPRKMSESKFKTSDLEHIQKRNETYDTYLNSYVTNFNKKSNMQRKMKLWFFIIVMFSLILILCAGILAIYKIVSKTLLETVDVAGIITAIVGMIASFLVLPKIIGDNLFPVKEDDQTNEMFSRMVEYDMRLREHYNQLQETEQKSDKSL